MNFSVCANARVNELQIHWNPPDTGKRSGKVLIKKKKQMSLGNAPIFILVKLDNSDEMIDFVILPVSLFFFKEEKQSEVQLHDQLKKGVFFVNLGRSICSKVK